jgi:hypothetical protein
MFSQGSANAQQFAAVAFCQITPSKRPFAFGGRRGTSSNWLAPRGAQTAKTRIVDRRQRITFSYMQEIHSRYKAQQRFE